MFGFLQNFRDAKTQVHQSALSIFLEKAGKTEDLIFFYCSLSDANAPSIQTVWVSA